MNIDFKEKKVLVTGATRGIGKAIALKYSELGAKVVITGTSDDKPTYFNDSIFYEKLEIKKNSSWEQRVIEIIGKYSGFDICINNAGINKVNKLFETNNSDINNILLVNLNAPIFIASEVSKKMIKNKSGYIVNIGSIFGVVSKEGRNPYTASKSGLIGVTKTMAIDLGKYNVLVNSVSPGFVDTELTRQVLGKEGMVEMKSKVPMKKLAKAEDIVPSILFLTSKYNTYITGQNIIVDGGFTCE
jgi:3-oxoacyl-[acyl-carrier protein] reductase